jgi:hypothetical protein
MIVAVAQQEDGPFNSEPRIEHVRGEAFTATLRMKRQSRIDQGPSISIELAATARPVLRFDCYAMRPHYHYDPVGANRRFEIDRVAHGDPVAFVGVALRERFRPLLEAASVPDVDELLSRHEHPRFVAEVTAAIARLHWGVTIHELEGIPFDMGPVVVLVRRREDHVRAGITFHFTRRGQQGEFLCLDCFGVDPHYHFAPGVIDIVRYLDPTVVDDAVAWGLDIIASGQVLRMFGESGAFDLAMALRDFPFRTFVDESLRPCVERLLGASPNRETS